MDEYGQIGPEKGDYAADMQAVWRALQDAGDPKPVFVKLADAGTLLRLLVAWAPAIGVPGSAPWPVDGTSEPLEDWFFVAVVEHGAYWFRVDTLQKGGYVASKLGLEARDGETVAEFLTRLNLVKENL